MSTAKTPIMRVFYTEFSTYETNIQPELINFIQNLFKIN